MSSLAIRDYEQALRYVYDLHERSGRDVYEGLVKGLRRLIPCDIASINLIDVRSRTIVAVDEPIGTCEAIDGIRTLERLSHEHPLFRFYSHTRDTRAYRFGDLPDTHLERTELYDQFYRPLRVRHELSVFFPLNGRIGAVGLERSTRDFSDRDRELLSLLMPHLQQAARRASQSPPEPLVALQGLLTARELDVAAAAMRGATNREIAGELCISARTVQKHLEHVYAKLGVRNRTATALALAAGVSLTEP
jgi:DNA-binding CsgD family transcriptional regulator